MGTRSRGVLAFLLVSFGLAWGAIFVGHWVFGLALGDPLVQLMLAAPIAFSPAIAAVVVRTWVTREGFRDAGLRPRVRAAWSSYLLAWVGPALVLAATVGLAVALGLYRPASPGEVVADVDLDPVGLLLLLAVPVVMVPMFWGEEFGWRSYLQQRVARSPLRAALLTGIIWAGWHYPLVFTDYSGYPDPFLGIAVWTPLLVAQAVILAWLFARSGSVWVVCLAHAGNNMIIGTLAGPLLEDAGGLSPYSVGLLELIPLAAICGWILLTGRLSPAAARPHEPVPDPFRRTHV